MAPPNLPTPFDVVVVCDDGPRAAAPPLRHLCRVSQGGYVGALPPELMTKILESWTISTPWLATSDERPMCAFLVKHGEPLTENSPLEQAWRLMHLATLVKPTLVSIRYCATVYSMSHVIAAGRWEPHWEHSYTVGERSWLTESDLDLFSAIVAADTEARKTRSLPETRLGRALSAFSGLPYTYSYNLRIVLAVSILEGLLAAEGEGSERVFKYRVPALAQSLGLPRFSADDAVAAYNVRSRMAHTGGLDVMRAEPVGRRDWRESRPTNDRIGSLLEAAEELIRVCLRHAFLDSDFRALLEDDVRRAEAFPVPAPIVARCRRCKAEEPRASVLRCAVCGRTWPDEERLAAMEAELKQLKKERHLSRGTTDAPTEGEDRAPNAADTPQSQAAVSDDNDARINPGRDA